MKNLALVGAAIVLFTIFAADVAVPPLTDSAIEISRRTWTGQRRSRCPVVALFRQAGTRSPLTAPASG